MNSYFTYIIPILTVLVACATFVVGYSQAKIASAKVKLDLYERRFNVYVTALNYCQAIYHINHLEIDECMLRLIKSCRESKFLFKEEDGIYEILTKIKKEGDTLLLFREYRKKGVNDSDNPFKAAIEEPHDFSKSLEDLEEKIKPYIQFKNVEGWTFF